MIHALHNESMSTTTHTHAPPRLALQAGEVAGRLGISERHLWSLHSSGRLPRPIRLGRAVRWPLGELDAWVAAGAPTRDVWEQNQRERM